MHALMARDYVEKQLAWERTAIYQRARRSDSEVTPGMASGGCLALFAEFPPVRT